MRISPLRAAIVLYLAIVVFAFAHLESVPRYRDPVRASGAMQALQRFAAERAYPATHSPRRGYIDAFEQAQRLRAEPGKSNRDTPPWHGIGPHNIGGRTLAVALNPINPSTVWAGAASGGLWRSFTGGVGPAAWQQVATGLPVLGVSSIAIDPADTLTMYIGTGEVYSYDDTQGGIAVRLTRGSFGMGILKTTDGGLSWSHALDWSYEQQRGIQVVRIDPTNPQTVWAGTTEGTYKSTDGGDSWQPVHETIMVTDLVIHSENPNTVVIACGNLESDGRGLYRTTDGGDSWTALGPAQGLPADYAGKTQLAICRNHPDVMMASVGNGGLGSDYTWLCRSEDAGATWQIVSTTDYSVWQGWFSHDVAIHPDNPQLVVAAGLNIWKSTNGGSNLVEKSSWSAWFFGQTPPGGPEGPPNYSHADHHDLVFHPTDPDVVYFANDGGIFRSLDAAETFSGCNGGYQSQQFYAGFSSSQRDSLLALGGMQDNSTAIYTGTVAWTRVIGGDGGWTGIDYFNDQVLYGSAQYLNLFKSYNGGASWSGISPPSGGSATSFIAPFALGGLSGSQVIYAGRAHIYKSINGGSQWSVVNGGMALDGNPILNLTVAPQSHLNLYATTAPVFTRAKVFRSRNGAGEFTDVTGSLPDRYPIGFAIAPDSDDTVYITFGGFGTGHIFKSIDGGDQWQDITGDLPDVPTSSVVVDPLYSDIVYVGNDIGVYVSQNGGTTWQDFSDGLPEAVVAMDLTVSATNRALRVSTYGNGVYQRPLAAPSVSAVDDDLPLAALRLDQNYPNPFNPSTTIAFHLGTAGRVQMAVFSLDGRHVATLIDGWRPAGRQELIWNGRDTADRRVASGTYVVRIEAGGRNASRRMTLVQ